MMGRVMSEIGLSVAVFLGRIFVALGQGLLAAVIVLSILSIAPLVEQASGSMQILASSLIGLAVAAAVFKRSGW